MYWSCKKRPTCIAWFKSGGLNDSSIVWNLRNALLTCTRRAPNRSSKICLSTPSKMERNCIAGNRWFGAHGGSGLADPRYEDAGPIAASADMLPMALDSRAPQ